MYFALLATALCSAAAPERPYLVEHYDAQLNIDFNHHSIAGVETMRLRSVQGSVREVELDANEIVVDSVHIGRVIQPFDQADGYLRIHLSKALLPGKELTIKATFHGSPSKGFLFLGGSVYTVYNTSHWLIVNHEPGDLATLSLSLNVPSGMAVVANGRNVSSKTKDNRLISKWDERRAIPDFVFGFAVGPFTRTSAQVEKTELQYLSTGHTAVQLNQIFRSTPHALQFFSGKAGVLYPSKTYSQILITGNPEQELGDFTLLPEKYGDTLLSHPDEEWLLAHELAHQWWGIGLACRDWADFWLNEGVATFMADVFLGDLYGPARYKHEIELAQQSYDGLKRAGKDHALCYRERNFEKEVGGRLPYNKGAVVLDLLRQQLGDEVFWKGFKTYTRENWGKTVTSENLQSAMEAAAGHSLGEFFNQWVYR